MTQPATTEGGATAATTQAPSETGQSPANGAGASGGDSPTIETLSRKIEELSGQRQHDQLTILDLTNRLSQKELAGQEEEEIESVDPLADLKDEDLAGMSNRDLIKTAVSAITKKIETELLPRIQTQLGRINDTVADQAARKDVADVAAAHPDFWNFQKPMLVLSQQPRYASLGAEDLYLLAKSKTGGGKTTVAPAAAATTTEPASLPRATTAPPQKTDAQKAAEAGAMSEKPGGSAAAGTAQKEFKTPEEAASDAYSKVFGNNK